MHTPILCFKDIFSMEIWDGRREKGQKERDRVAQTHRIDLPSLGSFKCLWQFESIFDILTPPLEVELQMLVNICCDFLTSTLLEFPFTEETE